MLHNSGKQIDNLTIRPEPVCCLQERILRFHQRWQFRFARQRRHSSGPHDKQLRISGTRANAMRDAQRDLLDLACPPPQLQPHCPQRRKTGQGRQVANHEMSSPPPCPIGNFACERCIGTTAHVLPAARMQLGNDRLIAPTDRHQLTARNNAGLLRSHPNGHLMGTDPRKIHAAVSPKIQDRCSGHPQPSYWGRFLMLWDKKSSPITAGRDEAEL